MREAHGNRAAAELAVQICAEFRKPESVPAAGVPAPSSQSPQLQTAAPLDRAKYKSVEQSSPVVARHENPYFAHLAMCTEGKEGAPPPVQPPLGWVLSTATQQAFKRLLKQCDNGTELEQLEIAIGKTEKPQLARSP